MYNLKLIDATEVAIMENNKLVTWLSRQLNDRGWSHRELARRSGISQAQISGILDGSRKAGWETCAAIAKTFGEQPLKIFGMAGLLDPKDDSKPMTDSAKIEAIYQHLQSPPQRPNGPAPEEVQQPGPEDVAEVSNALDQWRLRQVYDFARWQLKEQFNPPRSSGKKKEDRDAISVASLIELLPRMTPEQRNQLINLVRDLPDGEG